MTIRRMTALILSLTMGAGLWGCGAAPGLPDNQDGLTNDVNPDGDSTSTVDIFANGGAPSNEPSLSELKDSFVLSVPLTGVSLADDASEKIAAMAANVASPSWGSGDLLFNVARLKWDSLVQTVLSDAAARGGLIRMYFLPIGGLRAGPLNGNLLDLVPAAGMSTVGVLPLVFITTDFEGYPASGAGLDVELWSQSAQCATCSFEQPTRYFQQTNPLISSAEIRGLRETGLWNDRLIVIIPKAGIWWAESETSTTPVRNWMILKPTGGEASQVRCLTSDGVWPE